VVDGARLAFDLEQEDGGVVKRSFRLYSRSDVVTGNLWISKKQETNAPLVLLGHGASHSAESDYIEKLALALVRSYGFMAAALDAPGHGRRRSDPTAPPGLVMAEFIARWSSERKQLEDLYVKEHQEFLDALTSTSPYAPASVGWWGMSLATILGLAFIAQESRVRVAAIGLAGISGPTKESMALAATKVGVPVLFFVQHEDQIFPQESASALFEAIASPQKELMGYPGKHGEMPAEAFERAAKFLGEQLIELAS